MQRDLIVIFNSKRCTFFLLIPVNEDAYATYYTLLKNFCFFAALLSVKVPNHNSNITHETKAIQFYQLNCSKGLCSSNASLKPHADELTLLSILSIFLALLPSSTKQNTKNLCNQTNLYKIWIRSVVGTNPSNRWDKTDVNFCCVCNVPPPSRPPFTPCFTPDPTTHDTYIHSEVGMCAW